jgi:phosphatidylglycerol:prolipoprotein diacylglycerol transferase
MNPFLGWIYWNPPRHLFKLPYFDHPITIYGLCFVTGFIISYFILVWMFKQKLSRLPYLQERDIDSWPLLVDRLQIIQSTSSHLLSPFLQKLKPKLKNELLHLHCRQEPSKKLKDALLHLLNEAVPLYSKNKVEELLSPAMTTSTQWGFLLTDRLTWFVVLGTLIGARLGDVFFYDWPYFKEHLLEIFMVWKGGLASHGGVVGVLIGVYLYSRFVLKSFPEITFIELLDMMVVPSGLAACFIRIGNFFNQEILGPPTTMPWGIVFGDPVDGYPSLPRHPAQLYEALTYFVIFATMMLLWKKRGAALKPGIISGLFFTALFGFRFCIEFIKEPQSQLIDESFLMMGQYLSIPFVLMGIGLIMYGNRIYRKSF